MLIGVFSDVHDQLEHLDRALETFARMGAETLLFCGDFCSPIPARIIGAFPGDVHAVFGNGDADRFAMLKWATEAAPQFFLHGEHAELSLDGISVALTHYPLYGQALARTGDYDAVFSGHTHEKHREMFGSAVWLNPGEVLGWKDKPTCALFDTSTRESEFITL